MSDAAKPTNDGAGQRGAPPYVRPDNTGRYRWMPLEGTTSPCWSCGQETSRAMVDWGSQPPLALYFVCHPCATDRERSAVAFLKVVELAPTNPPFQAFVLDGAAAGIRDILGDWEAHTGVPVETSEQAWAILTELYRDRLPQALRDRLKEG